MNAENMETVLNHVSDQAEEIGRLHRDYDDACAELDRLKGEMAKANSKIAETVFETFTLGFNLMAIHGQIEDEPGFDEAKPLPENVAAVLKRYRAAAKAKSPKPAKKRTA